LTLREAALLAEARYKSGEINAVNSLLFLPFAKFLLATFCIMPENLLAGNV
jgi:hypothetical protein